MQKIRASKEYLFAIKYLFDRYQIEQITGISINEQKYITNQLKIILPTMVVNGKGSYYSFKQLQEFKIIKLMNEQFKIAKTDLKKAKEVIQQIDKTKDLTDKSIIHAYGQLFFIHTNDTQETIVNLLNKNNGQQSMFRFLILQDLEKQIDDVAKNILNFADYKKKKSYNSKLRIA